MSSSSPSNLEPENQPTSRSDKLQELFEEHMDRLNAGEPIDRQSIERDHPEFASQLIHELRFFESLGSVPDRTAPLGTLGDYTLRRQIGRGGMGVLCEVRRYVK